MQILRNSSSFSLEVKIMRDGKEDSVIIPAKGKAEILDDWVIPDNVKSLLGSNLIIINK